MKKTLLLLLAFVVCFTAAKADELTVADGTDTNQQVPCYGYYFDMSGKYGQMIYPKADLADMAGKDITKVSFYSAAIPANCNGAVLQISLKEVDNEVFVSSGGYYASYTPISDMTACGSHTVATGDTGLTFELTAPFSYSGDKNLAIEVRVTGTAGYAAFNYYGVAQESGHYTGLFYASSASPQPFLPKATFEYDGETLPYAAKVSPEACDFGAVATGSSNEMYVTVRNMGENAFTPQVTISGEDFSTTYTPAELANKQTDTIPVAFNPTAAGDFTGTLTVDCGEAGSFTVPLSGSAANEATVANGNGTSSYLPVYGLYYDESSQANQMIYPASMLTAINGKRIKSMTFYNNSATTYFSGGNVTFSLANTEETAFVSATRLTPEDLTQVYSAEAPGGTLSEWTVIFPDDVNFVYNGGSLLIDVATTRGTYKGVSFVGEDGHTNASWNSYGGGAGTLRSFLPKVKFTFEDATAPLGKVSVDPTEWAFDQLFVDDEPATKEFTVTNTTEADVTLALTGLDETQFSASSDVATVAANGGTATVTVTYTPSAAAGEHSATLTIVDELTVALSGSTIEHVISGSVTPDALSFETFVDTPDTKTITIENTGNTAFTPSFNALEAPFSIAEATEIAAGESQTFEVTYAPTAVGENEATLTVTINDVETAVALTGACYDAPQEIVVADGTDVNKIVPFYGYFTDQASVYGQMIYPASMLQNLVGKKILGFKFFSSTGVQFSGCTFDVTMGVTEQSSFSGTSRVTISNGVTASVTPVKNATEIEITFSEPFQYDGGNLIIDTYVTQNTNYSGADSSDGATQYYGVNQTEATAINSKGGSYGTAGSAQFLPKIAFSYMGAPVVEGVTLAEALAGEEGDVTIISDMKVVVANSNYAIVSDGEDNWLKVTGQNFTEGDVIGNVTGTISGLSLNPVMAVTAYQASNAIVDVVLEGLNLGTIHREALTALKSNEVAYFVGYYNAETSELCAFSSGSGLHIGMTTDNMTGSIVNGKQQTITGVVSLKAAWDAPAGAPARVAIDDDLAFENIQIDAVAASTPTGVENVKSIDGKEIQGIYNVNGQQVKNAQNGVYIIRYTDGTAAKVRF